MRVQMGKEPSNVPWWAYLNMAYGWWTVHSSRSPDQLNLWLSRAFKEE